MSILDQIRQLRDANDYNRDKMNSIANSIENAIGASECWNTLKPVFDTDEYMENLYYLAKQHDL